MIRILILLITLNALFPTVGLACASKTSTNMSMVSINETQNLTTDVTINVSSQMHCDNPNNMGMHSMQVMDCDSGCCANCVSISIALTTSSLASLSPMIASKPISSSINFYTHHTSPELQPPLI